MDYFSHVNPFEKWSILCLKVPEFSGVKNDGRYLPWDILLITVMKPGNFSFIIGFNENIDIAIYCVLPHGTASKKDDP